VSSTTFSNKLEGFSLVKVSQFHALLRNIRLG
jgi:hypothetical protein